MNAKNAALRAAQPSKPTAAARLGRIVPARGRRMTEEDIRDLSLPEGSEMSSELRAMNNQMDTDLPPIDLEELASVYQVSLWRLLLHPYIPRYSGRIVTHTSTNEAERILSRVGMVCQLGSFCYRSKTMAGLDLAQVPDHERAVIGRYVSFEQYAGQEIHVALKAGTYVLRIITESEVLGIVSDPACIKGYIK